MSFEIDWSVNSDSVPICDVAKMTGASQEWIKQTYRRGDLGPAPDVAFQVSKLPLYSIAALFVLLAAKERTSHLLRRWKHCRRLRGQPLSNCS